MNRVKKCDVYRSSNYYVLNKNVPFCAHFLFPSHSHTHTLGTCTHRFREVKPNTRTHTRKLVWCSLSSDVHSNDNTESSRRIFFMLLSLELLCVFVSLSISSIIKCKLNMNSLNRNMRLLIEMNTKGLFLPLELKIKLYCCVECLCLLKLFSMNLAQFWLGFFSNKKWFLLNGKNVI